MRTVRPYEAMLALLMPLCAVATAQFRPLRPQPPKPVPPPTPQAPLPPLASDGVRVTLVSGTESCPTCQEDGKITFTYRIDSEKAKAFVGINARLRPGEQQDAWQGHGSSGPFMLGQKNSLILILSPHGNNASSHAQFKVELGQQYELRDGSGQTKTVSIDSPQGYQFQFCRVDSTGCLDTQQASAPAKASPQPPGKNAQAGTAQIIANGKVIAGPGVAAGSSQPTTLAGELVKLQGVCTSNDGATITNIEWSYPKDPATGAGLVVGGFQGSSDLGKLADPTTSGKDAKVYFVVPGKHERLVLNCTDSTGRKSSATADIRVNSGDATIAVDVAPVSVYKEKGLIKLGPEPHATISFGCNQVQTGGVSVDISEEPQAEAITSGSFSWIQIVTRDDAFAQYNDQKTPTSVSTGTGLDTGYRNVSTYVKSTCNHSYDDPQLKLVSRALMVHRKFEARTYLMWNSGLPHSIPAVIGIAKWGYVSDATPDSKCKYGWCASANSVPLKSSVQKAISILDYPTWTTHTVNSF